MSVFAVSKHFEVFKKWLQKLGVRKIGKYLYNCMCKVDFMQPILYPLALFFIRKDSSSKNKFQKRKSLLAASGLSSAHLQIFKHMRQIYHSKKRDSISATRE